MKPLAVVRGAGDLGTAAGRRLHLCGFSVVHLEEAQPAVIRRAVAFASAVFERRTNVEGVTAILVRDALGARAVVAGGDVAVLVDPDGASIASLAPVLVVDAIMAKRDTGTRREMAPRVVALGPGFTAGVEVHAVIETCRGHDLGRVYTSGSARPDTGVPGVIAGVGAERVLRAPRGGCFRPLRAIGDDVGPGDTVGDVDGAGVITTIGGVVRGILFGGLAVREGQKIADVDPRGERAICFTISDKANAVAGGVLEAALSAAAVRAAVFQE